MVSVHPVDPACRAAQDVGMQFGFDSRDLVVLQETNHTVVWLRPDEMVVKVATRSDAEDGVRLEHVVASELTGIGARIASPLAHVQPTVHPGTGFLVTLWHRVDGKPRADVAGDHVATSLRLLHAALARTHVELPVVPGGADARSDGA